MTLNEASWDRDGIVKAASNSRRWWVAPLQQSSSSNVLDLPPVHVHVRLREGDVPALGAIELSRIAHSANIYPYPQRKCPQRCYLGELHAIT
jgi:hypothetical protein